MANPQFGERIPYSAVPVGELQDRTGALTMRMLLLLLVLLNLHASAAGRFAEHRFPLPQGFLALPSALQRSSGP